MAARLRDWVLSTARAALAGAPAADDAERHRSALALETAQLLALCGRAEEAGLLLDRVHAALEAAYGGALELGRPQGGGGGGGGAEEEGPRRLLLAAAERGRLRRDAAGDLRGGADALATSFRGLLRLAGGALDATSAEAGLDAAAALQQDGRAREAGAVISELRERLNGLINNGAAEPSWAAAAALRLRALEAAQLAGDGGGEGGAERAREALAEAVRLMRSEPGGLGPRALATLGAQSELAWLCLRSGRAQEAAEHAGAASRGLLEQLWEGHPAVVSAGLRLAAAVAAGGGGGGVSLRRALEAVAACRRGVAGLPGDHPLRLACDVFEGAIRAGAEPEEELPAAEAALEAARAGMRRRGRRCGMRAARHGSVTAGARRLTEMRACPNPRARGGDEMPGHPLEALAAAGRISALWRRGEAARTEALEKASASCVPTKPIAAAAPRVPEAACSLPPRIASVQEASLAAAGLQDDTHRALIRQLGFLRPPEQ